MTVPVTCFSDPEGWTQVAGEGGEDLRGRRWKVVGGNCVIRNSYNL
jgi:hypothetical protein